IIVRPKWLARSIARMVLNHSSEVIAVSGPVREHLQRYGRLGDPPVRVIHNGLDPAPFDRCDDILEARQEMGAGAENVLFGVIGRIHPWKGQSYFIESARLVADKCPEAHFVIIGGTFRGYEYLLNELEKQVNDLNLGDRLRILSHRRDVPRLMQALDVFVLPSTLPDPLPTVVLEAMAAHRPVVATAHGGAREMVLHGETGFLAPSNDVTAFAESMLELARDDEKRRRMGEAGRRRLEECFSRDRFFADVCDCVNHHLQLTRAAPKEKNLKAIATH
ncbi:MAG TPA: glycosyltransferase family 1 protein, partial [Bacteroidetes bacterium]|nr:glycosyltransferase family 1 protein [Bacteroidota bacterium]